MKKNILFLLILSPLLLFAQKQPRVGLVLSGGGAKGFAHIGVIRELEKAGVQIDYVGGTSMGAIIGGLYASGYRADEIEGIIRGQNFNSLLQDEIPRRQKPYFEKFFLEKHAITLPIVGGTIGLPMGLSKGQSVLNLFTEILAPVDDITDFSKLPIPFYCIATDIETGEEIVLDKGSLALALRASGSFPSLLNPVEIDGRLLVDGGVVNNFPVDKMKEKGVDIIIGVSVEGDLFKRKELSSIVAVLMQIINFQMYKKSEEHIKKVDIFMRPKVTEYNVISFDKADEIIEGGTRATKPYKVVFDSIAKLQTVKKRIPRIIKNKGMFLVDRIIIKGNKNYTKDYITNKLQIKEGDSTCYKTIAEKINTLTATKNFKRVDYNFTKSFSGKKLEMNIKEDDISSLLRVGLHYDILYRSGVLLNYNHKKILFRNDEVSFDLVIGDKIRYNLEYFLDDGFFGYGFSSRYNSFSSNILFNDNIINKINIDYRDFTNRLYAQTTLDRKFAFGFGLEHKNLNVFSETVLTNKSKTYFDFSNYLNGIAFLKMDTFNKTQFPTEGFYLDANFTWHLWSDRNKRVSQLAIESEPFARFSKVDARIGFATTLRKKLTFQNTTDVGFFLGNEKTDVFNYRLGGYNKNYINTFFPMYGYDFSELSDKSFLRSQLDIRYELFNRHYVSVIANYARLDNNIFEVIDLFEDLKSGYAVGYGLETVLGPIELKYSWSPDHNRNYWLFNLGFWF